MYSLQIITTIYEECTACRLELLFGRFPQYDTWSYIVGYYSFEIIRHVFILKLFFFPNFLSDHPTETEKGAYVGNELIERALPEKPIDF